MDLDALNQSLYFTASQATAVQNARNTQKKDQSQGTKKKNFASALERMQIENMLIQEGFPKEIAGMDLEDAVIYLKDEADKAADRLRESQMPDVFEDYRRKVSQFMKFVVKNNFKTKTKQRPGRRSLDPLYQVQIIDQKLDELARFMLQSHKDTLHKLAKIDEINGLLVDLMAT